MQGTVDHYQPKSLSPDLAYEWNNYRLAYDKVNQYKGEHTDVLDPFTVQRGWFVLDFASFLVKPSDGLSAAIHAAVSGTISRLRLNRDDALVQLRFSVVREYATGHIDLDFIHRYYPFIAYELDRQGLTQTIKKGFPQP